MGIADELRKLQELRDAGVLTDDEFAQAKASVLMAVKSPAGAAPADDRGSRTRIQLEQFKNRFATTTVEMNHYPIASRVWRQILDESEDLLIAVCGSERFRSFLDAADNLFELHNMSDNAARNRDRKAERGYDEQYEEALRSLKRRVASIEYRL